MITSSVLPVAHTVLAVHDATFYLAPAGGIAVMMLVLWLISIPLKNVSIVDIFWGIGFIVAAWCGMAVLYQAGTIPRADGMVKWHALLLPGMATIWGSRLAAYLAWRNIGKGEDYRYVAMRERNGPRFVWTSLLRVFLLQGVIMWVIALPLTSGIRHLAAQPCPWLAGGAALLWITGLFFEAVGDLQLAWFKQNPANKGRVMDQGLWRYTRHPNYFGESLIWWGHWLACLAVSDRTATWWTVLSPVLMTFLLLKVSGVALLEKSLRQRSPEYADYIARTSAFVPRRPRPAVTSHTADSTDNRSDS